MTKISLAALGLILFWSAVADAQVFMIHGMVSAPSKKPVGGFDVFLKDRDGSQVIAHTEANKSGDFFFSNLSRGTYDIVIELDGFRESRTPVQVGSATSLAVTGSTFQTVSIILVPDSRTRRLADERNAYTSAIVNEYAKGLEELDKKHPELAVTYLENVVKQVPEYLDAHLNLGFAYQELFRRDQAEVEFRKAQSLKPDSARPLVALGRLFAEEAAIQIQAGTKPGFIQFKLSQAREVLVEGISIDGNFASAFYYLGAVDFYSSDYLNAEKELKHALELKPELWEARIMLANVYIKQKKWNAALDNLEEFLMNNSSSPYRREADEVRAEVIERLRTVQ